jgi:hypothetical protein
VVVRLEERMRSHPDAYESSLTDREGEGLGHQGPRPLLLPLFTECVEGQFYELRL